MLSRAAGLIAIGCILGSVAFPWSGGTLLVVGLGMLAAAIVFRILEARA